MDTDISLVAGLDESYSEAEILKVIKILEKRLRANRDGRIKLIAEIDETVIRDTVNKLQTILKSKDLKMDTKDSIQAITKEVNAMADVATMAKKAAVEKLEFTKANKKVKDSAEDSTDAINRERSAMESMGSVDDILNGLSGSGRRCASVFQNMGNAFRDAFSVYSTVNLLEKSVEKLGEAGREALEIVKQYDDINVDLQLATGEDKGYVKGLISDYAELGNELSTLTQTVAESADNFLRQGRSIEETNKLIEDSIVLSKVAKTSGENASEILTATINGFQLAASEGSKVNDVLTSIDLHSASDASGIGDALTKVASMAKNTGLSLEKTAAMIATVKNATQDADSVIGTSLKTVLSRMNSIKAGKFVDEETGEALNDVEKVLSSIGFSMRDVNGQFKDAEVILDEVGKKWATLDKNTQKAVSTAMAGTYQANRLVSMFDNYDKVLELTNIAENSQGQALEKFDNSYLPSLEAKTQALQNSLEQLATTTFDDTLLASLLDVSKGMVDLITDTGILRGALVGLGTGGALYAFSQLAGFIGEATQEFSNLSEAMDMVNSGTVATNDMQRLIDLTSGLSQSQTRLVLSSQHLDEIQRMAILTNQNLAQGMSRELAEATARATLNTYGLTTAQQTLTSASVTLGNVIRGLYHSLIANPIVAVTLAVTAGATAFHKLKQAQEEVIQSAREASNVYQDNIKSVEDYTARYAELRTALLEAKGNEEETYKVKQQLLDLQNELNDKFADEYGAINLVTDAYKDQTEAIKNYNKEVANSFLNEERKGIARASKQMTKDRNYVLSMPDISLDTTEGKELKEIVDSYVKDGMYLVESTTGTVQIHLETDAQNAYDTINAFENDVREKAKELGDEHLFDSILDTSSISLKEAKETIDEYGDIFKQALMAELVVDDSKATVYNDALSAVDEYNKAVLNSEDPYSDEKVANAKKNLDEVKAKIKENADEWGKYSAVTDEVFAQADTRLLEFNEELQKNKDLLDDAKSLEGLNDLDVKSFNPGENEAFDRLKESAERYDLSVEELINTLVRLGIVQGEIATEVSEIEAPKWDFSTTISNLDTAKEKLSVLDETFSKLFDGDKKTNIGFEDFANINEAFSDVSGIENYMSRLQEAGNNTEKVTAVMRDLIGAYLEQSNILDNVTEDNKELIITMLEEVGIANAEQIVLAQLSHETEILALQKQFATETGHDLTEATIQEINEFLNMSEASEIAKQSIAQLALESMDFANMDLSTDSKIEELISLANAAGASATAIAKAKQAMNLVNSFDSGDFKVNGVGDLKKLEYAQQTYDSIINKMYDWDYEPLNANDFKITNSSKYKPTYAPQKVSGTSTADAIEKANKEMEKSQKTIDIFEIHIKKLDDAIGLLKTNLDNVQGAFAKNRLIDAEIGLNNEKLKNYSDALAMYTEKANQALVGIPSDIAEKIKNGAVSIVDYMDDSNGSISEAISEYTKWNDKISECKSSIAELRQELENLELQKFSNIAEDFTNQFDILETGKGWADKQISLFEEMGLFVGESFYLSQIEQTKKQLVLLEEQKSQLLKQLESAISSGRVEKGSEVWLSMINTIGKLQSQIISCQQTVEEFSNELLALNDKVFEEITDRFDSLHSELENLEGLFDDFDVSDGSGNWSKEGLTRLGLLAQNLELSLHEVQKYNEQIELLNQNYAEGKYSALEYAEKLSTLKSSQMDCVNSSEAIKGAIVELNSKLVEESIEAIEKETDAFRKNIEAQIESIEKTEELIQKRKELEGKTKTVSDLEKALAAVMNDDSASGIARRKKLEDEIRTAKEELAELERQNSVDNQKDALNQSLKDYEASQEAEIEKLRQSLEDKESLIFASLEAVKQNSAIIGEEIKNMAEYHGITISDAIITSWQNGENAIASYGSVLSAGTSAFIRNIMGVENEVYQLQNQANHTADELAWMFATRADNLVMQLMDSYNHEQMLNYMTEVLRNSLVNTLERDYDVSGITSALNSIASAADNARRSIEAMNNTPYKSPTYTSSETPKKTHTSIGGGSGGSINKNVMTAFAKGVHNLKQDEIAWTQEQGVGSELILSPTRNAILTDLRKGDTVLTKKQTDMILEWSKLNPVNFVPDSVRNMVGELSRMQPQIVNRNTSKPITVNNSITFTGDINDTNHFTKQVTGIINRELDKSYKELMNEIRY